jgi:outer membrane murein-binding lipoprotein Lpp
MTIETLEAERAELQNSLAHWQRQLAEAHNAAARARQQIDIHTGHLERVGIWIERLTSEPVAE